MPYYVYTTYGMSSGPTPREAYQRLSSAARGFLRVRWNDLLGVSTYLRGVPRNLRIYGDSRA